MVFAYLAVQKGRPVPRDELAEVLWGEDLPATWEKALRVLMTKLRALLEECGLDGARALTSAFGCYQLTLPPDTWIDVDAAANAVDGAEAALASDELDEACAQAATAAELARRSFLPGEEGPWVEEQRRGLHDMLVRALECVRDASFAAGVSGDALRYAAEITELEPFRESSYRALMQAHVAAGNPAEALRVYERCRRFLADELGAFPSPETEAVYRQTLHDPPVRSESVPREDGPRDGLPPPGDAGSPRQGRRRRIAVSGALLAAVAAIAAGLAFTSGDNGVKLLPSSLVRLNPKTLEPTKVVEIGPRADGVMVSARYLWVTHGILRYGSGGHTNRYGARNSGDRKLERINPSTGEVTPVAGGLAPCGMTPDPSGDPWVANCYASGEGDIVRVDAKTLNFGTHYPVPNSQGFVRGMTYGGGSLWVSPAFNGEPTGDGYYELSRLRLNPLTGELLPPRQVRLERKPGGLAWSERQGGNLWITGSRSSVSRVHVASGAQRHIDGVGEAPSAVLVHGDQVWVGDWLHATVTHFSAVKFDTPHRIRLRVEHFPSGVTSLAAGAGYIWATVPDDHALWRIDPTSGQTKRIPLTYYPWGVSVGAGGIWVTLRAHDGPPNPES
ncbi:MAG TPA: BTAD domain-containing putative transcriptional regulator [Gaiellaceae bacterium]|nr:BTAD domain-containing putative transcriptional regulator [Gaiellaceae bacterium]